MQYALHLTINGHATLARMQTWDAPLECEQELQTLHPLWFHAFAEEALNNFKCYAPEGTTLPEWLGVNVPQFTHPMRFGYIIKEVED